MKYLLNFLLCLFTFLAEAQQIVDFENFELDDESFLNGSDLSGGFQSGPLFFSNSYNAAGGFWSEWAISNVTDVLTPGFANQYSAIAGAGVNGTKNYAVCYDLGGTSITNNDGANSPQIKGINIANNAYAYYSMLEGDQFAKKFGGATGDDPDYLFITIRAIVNGAPSVDSIDVYLADYTFDDNSKDYILKEWKYIDISALNAKEGLVFSMSSSDVGQFGINTPTYFCVDDIELAGPSSNQEEGQIDEITIFPNPVSDVLRIETNLFKVSKCEIYNMQGVKVYSNETLGDFEINIAGFQTGKYIVRIQNDLGIRQSAFLKI